MKPLSENMMLRLGYRRRYSSKENEPFGIIKAFDTLTRWEIMKTLELPVDEIMRRLYEVLVIELG